MASPAAWAQEARQAAGERLTSLPSLTGQEEVWRFTPPADLALEGPEPEAPGAAAIGPADAVPSSDSRRLPLKFSTV